MPRAVTSPLAPRRRSALERSDVSPSSARVTKPVGVPGIAATLAVLVGGGCGSDALTSGVDWRTCDGGGTVRLAVSPRVLVRDDPVQLAITWQLNEVIHGPRATLSLDGAEVDPEAGTGVENGVDIEVEVPLGHDPDGSFATYEGSLLNPFGAGARPGRITILAQASIDAGCYTSAVATTTVELE